MARGSRQAWPDVDILVVDDHRVFGEALAMRLEAEPGVGRVWVADDLGSARATLPLLGDGLLLLDYQLGDVCGLELMDDIARLEPRPTVVVLSGVNDPDAIVAGVHAGVDAWILKAEGYGALVEVAVDARDQVMTLPRRSLRQVIQRLMTQHPAVAAPPSFLDEISPRDGRAPAAGRGSEPRRDRCPALRLAAHGAYPRPAPPSTGARQLQRRPRRPSPRGRPPPVTPDVRRTA